MADAPSRDAVLRSLVEERTVDIVTTGRRSGQPRTTEIWTTVLWGRTYLCGSPNATRPGIERTPRDWLANLLVHPDLVVRLKASVAVDLPATAARVTDPDERRRVLTAPSTAYYRDAVSLDAALAHSPMVRLTFRDDAAWLNDALAAPTGTRPQR